MLFITDNAIGIFCIIVASLAIILGFGILISSYPIRFFINMIYKKPEEEINKYYFYYQKATAYRMLFSIHTTISNTFKIISPTMTFITVYCAMDKNEYILLCSLLAAISSVVGIMIPSEKYIKIYVQAARVLEYELNTDYGSEDKNKEKLKEAYIKAENIIANDFV